MSPRPEGAPNCYDCKHRGTVAGSCHSSCDHPKANGVASPLAELMAILGPARGLGIPPLPTAEALGVTGNEHGIRNGWFAWPYNFDPVWLNTCNGFEAKAAAKEVAS